MILKGKSEFFWTIGRRIKLNLDDGDSETLYKYGGVELFCKFSIPFFTKLQNRGSFTVSTMEKLLKDCLENVEGDYAGVGHPDWWKRGGQAGRLNSGALNIVCQEMTKALHKATGRVAAEIWLSAGWFLNRRIVRRLEETENALCRRNLAATYWPHFLMWSYTSD